MDSVNGSAFVQFLCYADDGFLSHSVADHVSMGVAEDTLHELVLPVVVVGESPQ